MFKTLTAASSPTIRLLSLSLYHSQVRELIDVSLLELIGRGLRKSVRSLFTSLTHTPFFSSVLSPHLSLELSCVDCSSIHVWVSLFVSHPVECWLLGLSSVGSEVRVVAKHLLVHLVPLGRVRGVRILVLEDVGGGAFDRVESHPH